MSCHVMWCRVTARCCSYGTQSTLKTRIRTYFILLEVTATDRWPSVDMTSQLLYRIISAFLPSPNLSPLIAITFFIFAIILYTYSVRLPLSPSLTANHGSFSPFPPGLFTDSDQKSNRKREREESAAAAAEEAGNKRKEMKRARVIIPTGTWLCTDSAHTTNPSLSLSLPLLLSLVHQRPE